MAVTSSELRRVARRAIALPCEMITSWCNEPLTGRCSDLSPLGMAWSMSLPLSGRGRVVAPVDAGEPVVLSFRPPRCRDALTLFGRVRRAGGPLRVEFEALTTEEHICLFDALRGIPPRLPSQQAVRL